MEDSTRPIRIVVINGSVRPNNYTSMASAYVVDELRKHPRQKCFTNRPQYSLRIERWQRLVSEW
jgi:hypothetical protein